jgi:hypothetical protein
LSCHSVLDSLQQQGTSGMRFVCNQISVYLFKTSSALQIPKTAYRRIWNSHYLQEPFAVFQLVRAEFHDYRRCNTLQQTQLQLD